MEEWLGGALQIAGVVAMIVGLTVLFGWPWAALIVGALAAVIGVLIEAERPRTTNAG